VDVVFVGKQLDERHKLQRSVISYFMCLGGIVFCVRCKKQREAKQVSSLYELQLKGYLMSEADW
jgi:hypothetical protein